MAIVQRKRPCRRYRRSIWGSLERSLRQPRSLFSYVMSFLTGAATIAAMVPLFSVLYLLIKRGRAGLNWVRLLNFRRRR